MRPPAKIIFNFGKKQIPGIYMGSSEKSRLESVSGSNQRLAFSPCRAICWFKPWLIVSHFFDFGKQLLVRQVNGNSG
jgi:hypothetical protein